MTVDEILEVLTKREEVDANRRAYEWLIDYIAVNSQKFDSENKTEVWGEIDDEAVYFIRSVFDREMKKNGQDARSFLSWAKRNELISCQEGRRDKLKRLSGSSLVTRCVALKVDKIKENYAETHENDTEELPF